MECYYECRKRKRYTVNAAEFEINFEKKLLILKKELDDHTYTPGRSICFVVTYPKPREIFAADFRDRIVHHVLVSYLEPIWESKFIGQSYACRKGKGAHAAIKDLDRYIRKVTAGGHKEAYYLQVDIRSFFVSLNKDILFGLVKKHVQNPEILWLTKLLLYNNPTTNYYRKSQMSLFDLIPDHKSLFKVPPNQGLPIGNLTSQFFANIYLNELDQYVKHVLKVKYYARYVDDLVMLSDDQEQLMEWKNKIDAFLQEKLKLKLHPDKQKLENISSGIDFVGFVMKPEYTLMRRRIVKNFKEKLWKLNLNPEKLTKDNAKEILSVVNSYYGQFKYGNTFSLRRKMWERNFGVLRNYFEPVDKNFSYMRILAEPYFGSITTGPVTAGK